MNLSILIPARSEEFLSRTIQDLLKNIRGNTEIIVVIDGGSLPSDIPDNPKITIIHCKKSIGQRAAINLAAKRSKAKYVMKLDAHCAVSPGFDTQLLIDIKGHNDWTILPTMFSLQPDTWTPDPYTKAVSMCFDANLHFQYFHDYESHQKGDLVETMSCIGAAWMLTREKYWELNICDEAHGGWGQQGTEISCKTWLSGGKLIVSKNCWFAHLFRTKTGFPYHLTCKNIYNARQYSQNLWNKNNWPQAIHKLDWLIKKFNPPGWDNGSSIKGIIYYTNNKLNSEIEQRVQEQLNLIGLPIVCSSSKPILHFGNRNIHHHKTMPRQILAALKASESDVIFFCEPNVLYHPTHFEFDPPDRDVLYFNENTWVVNSKTQQSLSDPVRKSSGLCAYRKIAIEYYSNTTDKYKIKSWKSKFPNIDIQHEHSIIEYNWTNNKSVPGWVPDGF